MKCIALRIKEGLLTFVVDKNKSEAKKLQITRFIALANVGNPNKEKYLYAFNISPGELTAKVPEDCTETPFPDEAASRAKGKSISPCEYSDQLFAAKLHP